MKIKSFDALNDACKKNELDRFNEYSHEQKVTFLKINGIHLGRAYGGTYIEKRNQVYIKGLKDPFSGEWFVGEYRSKVYKPKNGETIPVRIYLKKNDTNGLPHYICEYAGNKNNKRQCSSTKEINGIPVQSVANFYRETEQKILARKDYTEKLKTEREQKEKQRQEEKRLEEERINAKRRQQEIEAKKVAAARAQRELERKQKWYTVLSDEDKQRLLWLEYDVKTNCYYIQKYIPWWKIDSMWENYSDFDIRCSENLLLFKQEYCKDYKIFSFYSIKIMEAIEQIAIKNKFGMEQVMLVAVPSSKHDKESNIARSIKVISSRNSSYVNWSDRSGILTRTVDINSSHLSSGNRPTLYTHMASIECRFNTDDLELKNTYYILIDDIITTGTTMDACEKILSQIVPREKIIKLAIGRTV